MRFYYRDSVEERVINDRNIEMSIIRMKKHFDLLTNIIKFVQNLPVWVVSVG